MWIKTSTSFNGRDGGYIKNDFVFKFGGNGAKPIPRCCDISGGVTCRNVDLTLDNPSDDK